MKNIYETILRFLSAIIAELFILITLPFVIALFLLAFIENIWGMMIAYISKSDIIKFWNNK
jgi:hypothetical protein